MPQVIVKGISREKTAALAPRIAETVASIIAVPEEWIVVEHNEVAFFRGGKADAQSAMVVIQWKQRPKELVPHFEHLTGDGSGVTVPGDEIGIEILFHHSDPAF